jgi:hypothetical protein
VICLFSENKFIRSFFIENGYSAEVSQLPSGEINLRYSGGSYFDQSQALTGTDVTGAFTEGLEFFKSNEGIRLGKINELTLTSAGTEGFTKINANEFFKR